MAIKTIIKHEQKPLTTNQTVTLQVPLYGTIHNLILRFNLTGNAPATKAAILAQIGNIRATINGKDFVNCDVSKLFAAYEFLGQGVYEGLGVDGDIELNIGRLVFNDPNVRDALGLGTANINSLQLSVTAKTISTVLGVQAYTVRSPEERNLGTFAKLIDYPQSFNSTGQHTVDTLPRDPDSVYLAVLTNFGASGTITSGEARRNNVILIEDVPLDTNKLKLSSDRFAQPASYFVYSFVDGGSGTVLPMSGTTDFRLLTTFSVAPGAGGYTLSALTLSNVAVNAAQ